MQHINHLHSYQILFLFYCVFHLIFMFRERSFILEALKQGNLASSTRLLGFMFGNAVCLAFVYDTFKYGLDYHKLIVMLLFVLLMYGVVKWSQLMEIKNGKPMVINNSAAPSITQPQVEVNPEKEN